MKRNERITSSWGFLAQGTKAALCLLVLMLSVQAVFAQKDPKQFVYNGFTYLYNGDGTVAFTGNKFKEAGKTDKDKYSKEKPYPEVIVVPDFAYDERTGNTYPVTSVSNGACEGDAQAYCNTRKIIIGDNVVQIGNDSFKSFGKRDKTSGSREIILGKHVTQIGENSFTEFGKGELKDKKNNQEQFKVYIQTDYKPYCKIEGEKLKSNPFREVRGVTFYVKSEEVYKTFMTTDKDEMKEDSWPKFDANDKKNIKEGRRNEYNYAGFELVSTTGNKWQTAVFPETMNATKLAQYYGPETKVARMSADEYTYDDEKGYIVCFKEVDGDVEANVPLLIKPTWENCLYVGDGHYPDDRSNTISVEDKDRGYVINMIGVTSSVTDDGYTLTHGQIYLRSWIENGEEFLRFYQAVSDNPTENPATDVRVRKGKCYFEVRDRNNDIVTFKTLDYQIDENVTGVEKVQRAPAVQDGRIYSITGQYEGTSLEGLPKGIHIMNGRKFVVK